MSAQQLAALAFQAQMAAIALGQQQTTIIPEPPQVKPLKPHQMTAALAVQNHSTKPAPRINQPKSGAARVRNEPCRRQ